MDHIRLTEERGFLLVEMSSPDAPEEIQRMPLMPLSDSEGLLLASLAGEGETVRCLTLDGEERIAVSGFLLRKMAR